MNKIIGIHIKELRKREKLTQIQFSHRIGIDNSQLSKIEQGKLMPTLAQLIEIASKFNVSIDWLVNLSNTTTKETSEKALSDEGNIDKLNEKQVLERLNYLEQNIDSITNEKLKLIESKIIAGTLSTNKLLRIVLLQLDIDEKKINKIDKEDEMRI
ncbi:helix-turn-helix domain-containing protein [Elizabethkingia argentiflava]|uniref:Helix-turn-helix domain-containing protein n=1 Tax=Elizabethkingia argenteiflava TaxID=2681556 RepID=A0A845PVW2_9FLAO|nr:helix-turn-helix transcriptional regulator [Elizabethkingia argenteiflava]NAW50607.1 helix-turn-helix domain-containing protein [Elizabethkingia argenteiflava]